MNLALILKVDGITKFGFRLNKELYSSELGITYSHVVVTKYKTHCIIQILDDSGHLHIKPLLPGSMSPYHEGLKVFKAYYETAKSERTLYNTSYSLN